MRCRPPIIPLRISIRIHLDRSNPPKVPAQNKKTRDLLHNICDLRHTVEVILGMNGVAVARNGLILWENGATGSRKVFKYLPGLRDAIKNLKKTENTENP